MCSLLKYSLFGFSLYVCFYLYKFVFTFIISLLVCLKSLSLYPLGSVHLQILLVAPRCYFLRMESHL